MKKLEVLVNSQYIATVLLNILPHCFLLLLRDQKVGQAADLAHIKTEEKKKKRTNSRDQQQTDSQTSNMIPTLTEERRQSQDRTNTHSYNSSHYKQSITGWAEESFLRRTQHTHVGAA